jgi:hypothetical protein
MKNAATTIRNSRGMLERMEENHFVGAFSIVLTITAVTLNTSVMISDYSDYFTRIFTLILGDILSSFYV